MGKKTKKKMDKYGVAAVCFYLASSAFYVAAALQFWHGTQNNQGVVSLCLASSMLCLGSVMLNKSNKGNHDGKDNK